MQNDHTGMDAPPERMIRVESIRLGVLIERRESRSAWQRWLWRPAGVIAFSPAADGWRRLHDRDAEALFHASHLALTLYQDEAGTYLQNLARPRPEVYVVLRAMGEADPERPVRPFLLTASPNEAATYSEAEDGVYPVPMPPNIAAWVRRFAEAHHRPEPFVRRNRREREESAAAAGRRGGGVARRRPAWEVSQTRGAARNGRH